MTKKITKKVKKVKLQKNLNFQSGILIDEFYLKQAYKIRIDFENVNLMIDEKKSEIASLKFRMESLKGELKKTPKQMIKTDDKSVLESVYKILDQLDAESQKILKLINPIEEKMKDLQKEENKLYLTLKEKYPHATDNELKDSIVAYIIDKKRDQ